jgi:pseudouridine-5'-monophosphatase
MGIPDSTNGDIFHDWAKVPIPREQFAQELREQMQIHFQSCEPMPGAGKLLSDLSHAQNSSGDRIKLALASSSKSHGFKLKTSRPETKQLLDFIEPKQRILGDDARLRPGRGKPAPDIYLIALQSLNSAANTKEAIMPEECLVFEDSVTGVEAGRRAGMRVVWVPHPDVAAEYGKKQKQVLAGKFGTNALGNDWELEGVDNGWAESISSLEDFDYKKYGINVL